MKKYYSVIMILLLIIIFICNVYLHLTNNKESYNGSYNGMEFIRNFNHDNNYVIGLYNGYVSISTHRGGIKPFLKTLRSHNKKCIIIILCEQHNITSELVEICNQHNAIIYDKFTSMEIVSHYRNNAIRKVIDNLENIDKILLTDVEDVTFQSDPFKIHLEKDLYCSVEYSSNERESLNGDWMETCKNNNLEINIEPKNIICNGTILGNKQGIQNYLKFDKDNYNPTNSCLDQGLLNIYIHYYCDSYIAPTNEKSLILTTSGLNKDFDFVKKDGKILNSEGKVYSIIHDNGRFNFFESIN
jgi:hypothetical protein